MKIAIIGSGYVGLVSGVCLANIGHHVICVDNNLEKIKKPMIVIAGKNDPRVPVSESQQIADGLKKQGTPVWLMIAKDEGHGYRKKPNLDYQFYATVEFLQQYLLQ